MERTLRRLLMSPLNHGLAKLGKLRLTGRENRGGLGGIARLRPSAGLAVPHSPAALWHPGVLPGTSLGSIHAADDCGSAALGLASCSHGGSAAHCGASMPRPTTTTTPTTTAAPAAGGPPVASALLPPGLRPSGSSVLRSPSGPPTAYAARRRRRRQVACHNCEYKILSRDLRRRRRPIANALAHWAFFPSTLTAVKGEGKKNDVVMVPSAR